MFPSALALQSQLAASSGGGNALLRTVDTNMLGPSVQSIWMGERRKRKSAYTLTDLNRLPPNVVEVLGQANVAYFAGQNSEAVKHLLEVLKVAPRLPDVYDTLAMIFDDMGDMYMAYKMQLFKTINIKLPTTVGIMQWEKVCQLGYKLGYKDQSLECLRRVLLFRDSRTVGGNAPLRHLKMKTLLHLELQQKIEAFRMLQLFGEKDGNCAGILFSYTNYGDYYETHEDLFENLKFYVYHVTHFMGPQEFSADMLRYFHQRQNKELMKYSPRLFVDLSPTEKTYYFHSIRKIVDGIFEILEGKESKAEVLVSFNFVINQILACFSYVKMESNRGQVLRNTNLSRWAMYLPFDVVTLLCIAKLRSQPEEEDTVMQELNCMTMMHGASYLSDLVRKSDEEGEEEEEEEEEEEDDDVDEDANSDDEARVPKAFRESRAQLNVPAYNINIGISFYEKLSGIKQAIRLAEELMDREMTSRSLKLMEQCYNAFDYFMTQAQKEFLNLYKNDCINFWKRLAILYMRHKNPKFAFKCCVNFFDYYPNDEISTELFELALLLTEEHQDLESKKNIIYQLHDAHYSLLQLRYSTFMNDSATTAAATEALSADRSSTVVDGKGGNDSATRERIDFENDYTDYRSMTASGGGGSGGGGNNGEQNRAGKNDFEVIGDGEKGDDGKEGNRTSNYTYDKENKVFRSYLTEGILGEHSPAMLCDFLAQYLESGYIGEPDPIPILPKPLKRMSLSFIDREVKGLLFYSKSLFDREMYKLCSIYSFCILSDYFFEVNRQGMFFRNLVGLQKSKGRRQTCISLKDFSQDTSMASPEALFGDEEQCKHLFWFLSALTAFSDLTSTVTFEEVEELLSQFKTCVEKCSIVDDYIAEFIDSCDNQVVVYKNAFREEEELEAAKKGDLEASKKHKYGGGSSGRRIIIFGSANHTTTTSTTSADDVEGASTSGGGSSVNEMSSKSKKKKLTESNDADVDLDNPKEDGSASKKKRKKVGLLLDADNFSLNPKAPVTSAFVPHKSVGEFNESFINNPFVSSCSGISATATAAAERLWQYPNDVAAANILCRELDNYNLRSINAMSMERDFAANISVIHLQRKYPDSFIANMLCGHGNHSKKPADSLIRYIDAYSKFPEDPLNNLCISSFLSSSSKMSKNCRIITYPYIKSLLFLEKYKEGRQRYISDIEDITKVLRSEELSGSTGGMNNNSSSSSSSSSSNSDDTTNEINSSNLICVNDINLEIEYNFGRTFHSMGLMHLALKHYRGVMSIGDAAKDRLERYDISIVKKGAFNAVLILKGAGSLEEAFSVTSKYLTV